MLNYKTLLLALFTLSTHNMAATFAPAQSQKASSAQVAFDASTLDKNSASFKSYDTNYQIISRAYAIKSSAVAGATAQNAQNIKGLWSKKIGHYQIIIPQQSKLLATADSAANFANNHKVVYNNDTQQVGVITGDIAVKLKTFSKRQIKNIAQTYGLTTIAKFKHLNLVFFRVANGADIVLINQQLSADSAIERADIEILESINTAD